MKNMRCFCIMLCWLSIPLYAMEGKDKDKEAASVTITDNTSLSMRRKSEPGRAGTPARTRKSKTVSHSEAPHSFSGHNSSSKEISSSPSFSSSSNNNSPRLTQPITQTISTTSGIYQNPSFHKSSPHSHSPTDSSPRIRHVHITQPSLSDKKEKKKAQYRSLLISKKDFSKETLSLIQANKAHALGQAQSWGKSNSAMVTIYNAMTEDFLENLQVLGLLNLYCLDLIKQKGPFQTILDENRNELYSKINAPARNLCFTQLQLLISKRCNNQIIWPNASRLDNQGAYFLDLLSKNESSQLNQYTNPLSAGLITGIFLLQIEGDPAVKEKLKQIAGNSKIQKYLRKQLKGTLATMTALIS